jgi:Kdo2-lipid IVA lauroyltransferase/acyltransferase
MKRILRFIPFALLVLVTFPFALLPYGIALRTGEVLGLLIFYFWRSRRAIALGNLQEAVDRGALSLSSSPRSVIRQNFKNLGKLIMEVIKIHYGFGDSIFRTVELRGVENFRKAHDKGKGVILITGHCGNWELMAVYLSLNLTKVKVVARKQDNDYINRFIEKTREKYGNSVIYKEGALKKILTSLKKNETVGILMDQSVIRSEGFVIHFLGKNAYTLKTPAIIARKTGTPIIPAFIRRTGNGHVIEIGEEIPLTEAGDVDTALLHDTIIFSRSIEEFIKKYPADWLWIHRRWKRTGK